MSVASRLTRRSEDLGRGVSVTLPQWKLLPDIGLYMDQVMTLMERVFVAEPGAGGITKSMVNNYVKAGLIRRPTGRKYDRDQLAQLVMIAVFKQALSMEEIARVLAVLCEKDVESGYARFCREFASGGVREESGDAVSAAILAAACVMRARERIAQL